VLAEAFSTGVLYTLDMSALLGFITLILLAFAGIWGLQAGGAISQAVILLLSSLAAFGLWRAQQSATREQELKAKLVTDKKVLYKLYLDIVEELLGRAGPKVNAQQVASTLKKLNTFVFGSLLIASDEVVIAHDRFLRASKILDPATKAPDEKMLLPAVADVLMAMRRDAGETTTNLRPIDLMATFVRDVEDMSSSFDRWASERARAWPSASKRP
jgi:hypothetical protein